MKSLRQIIRRIIVESVGHPKMDELVQRFLDDPRGLRISIHGPEHVYNGYSIEMIDTTATPMYSIGYIELRYFPYRDPDSECHGAYEITGYSRMNQNDNLGPLLYDIGIELAGKRGLMSDRASVSPAAQDMWEKYLIMRDDVKRKQLDSKVFNWTDTEDDDCELYTSYKRYTNSGRSVGADPNNEYKTWIQGEKTSPLSKVYYKEGTPVMDRLKDRIIMDDSEGTSGEIS